MSAVASATGRRRRVAVWVVVIALAAMIAAAVWIVARGMMANDELSAAAPLAGEIQQALADGDTDRAASTAQDLAAHASTAASLTGDPIWRAAEILPWAGPNLTAVRVLAGQLDQVAAKAILPLAELGTTIDPSAFAAVDGRITTAPLLDARPKVAEAVRVITGATAAVGALDTSQLVPPIADATTTFGAALAEAAAATDMLDSSVRLIPGMLGGDGPRNYLVLFQNNAELRAGGGIPGALALLHAEDGRLSIVDQASTSDFEPAEQPVLPLPGADQELYGTQIGRYLQDVTETPDFTVAAPLAAEMWQRTRGTAVDGVIAVDPVGLSFLLEATGPVTLPNGDVLSSDTAVHTLLVDVYARYPDDAEQNAYFASAAATVFGALASGAVDPTRLVEAFGRIADEHRAAIWSAHEDEQRVLGATTLGGMLASQDQLGDEAYGVYLNDRTAAKMGVYLRVDTSTDVVDVRDDGRSTVEVTTTFTNAAPADAATSLPARTTGEGLAGVPPGTIATNVTAYSPSGAFDAGVLRDGVEVGYQSVAVGDRVANNVGVDLAPGQSMTVVFRFISAAPGQVKPVVITTPLLSG